METKEKPFNYELIISMVIVMLTLIGTTVPLHLHMDNKMEEHRRESKEILTAMNEEIKGIQIEMKDFHGRLCAIEERNKERK